MKQLFFSLLLVFSVLSTASAQSGPGYQQTDVFEQFQKEVQSMMEAFEQMPDFSRVWTDTLHIDGFNFHQGQDGFSGVQPDPMNVDEMFKWMEEQFSQFEPLPYFEDRSQEFDWEVEPLVPAPDKMEEGESPKQKAPATKPRKKRRVYSL
ncbi:MAG: hypothetical protein AAFV95_16725 [Bacteroidota bacterium]